MSLACCRPVSDGGTSTSGHRNAGPATRSARPAAAARPGTVRRNPAPQRVLRAQVRGAPTGSPPGTISTVAVHHARRRSPTTRRSCPPYGTNLTYPLERYVKLHQTSGTTGKAPIRVLDTEESWDWWARCWGHVYRGAGVGAGRSGVLRVLVRSVHRLLGRVRGRAHGWRDDHPGRRHADRAAPAGHARQRRDRAVLHAHVRAAPGRDGRAAGHRPGRLARPRHGPRRRAGRERAGRTRAHRTGLRRPLSRSHGHDRAGRHGLHLPGAGRRAPDRVRVHLRGGRSADAAAGPERRAGRAGRHQSRPRRHAADSLPHRRPGPARPRRRVAAGAPLPAWTAAFSVAPTTWWSSAASTCFPSAIEGVLREFPEVSEFRIEVFPGRRWSRSACCSTRCPAPKTSLAEAVANRLHDRLLLRVPCELVPPGSLPRFESEGAATCSADRLARVARSPATCSQADASPKSAYSRVAVPLVLQPGGPPSETRVALPGISLRGRALLSTPTIPGTRTSPLHRSIRTRRR